MITDNGPIHTSAAGEELWSHGTAAFPCGCYRTDLHTDEVPWHWHAEYEFGLCIEGLIDYRAGGERLLLRGGDAVFVNGGVPHTETHATGPEESCVEGSLVCRPSMLYGTEQSSIYHSYFRRLAGPTAPQVVHLPADGEPWQREAAAAAHRAHAAVAADERYADVTARELLTRVCLAVLEHAELGRAGAALKTGGRDLERARIMISFIEEHHAEPIGVSEIAGAANVSVREAQRAFRSVVGVSPMSYLTDWRLYEASRLLRTTGEPVSTVARQVGFTSHSHFARRFRERYGHTPAEHRDL